MKNPISILTALPVNKRLWLLILCFLPALHTAIAQKVNPMFYKEIQLSHKPYTLHTLTREIQRQSGITFSYDAVKIDPDRKVRLRRGIDRLTVKELLTVLRKKTGISYKIVSNSHIIYTPPGKGTKNKQPRKYKTRQRKKELYVAPADETADEEPYIPVLREDSTFQHQIVVVGDSSLAVAYYLSGGGGSGGAYAGNSVPKYPVTADQLEQQENTFHGRADRNQGFYTPLGQTATFTFIKQSGFLAAGFTADETYYLNPTLKAGFSFLYGTIAYNWGNFPHWRYGVGASAQINSRWSGHFEYSTGSKVSQRYTIQAFDTFQPPPIDSQQVPPIITERNTPLLVQSRLNRFTLAAEWNMGRNVYLGAGLTLNILKTTYYSNGNPVALSDILPVGYDADLKYKTIDPPYVFSNSYSGNNSSNTKIWIGLQLRLTYKLNFFEP